MRRVKSTEIFFLYPKSKILPTMGALPSRVRRDRGITEVPPPYHATNRISSPWWRIERRKDIPTPVPIPSQEVKPCEKTPVPIPSQEVKPCEKTPVPIPSQEVKPRAKIQNKSILPLRDELKEVITHALSNGYPGRYTGQHQDSSCFFTGDEEDLIGHVSLAYVPKTIKLIVSEECVTLDLGKGVPIKFFEQDVKNAKGEKIDVLTNMLVSRMLDKF
jgi:hypothetical protein